MLPMTSSGAASPLMLMNSIMIAKHQIMTNRSRRLKYTKNYTRICDFVITFAKSPLTHQSTEHKKEINAMVVGGVEV
jgi:hypothetical protein